MSSLYAFVPGFFIQDDTNTAPAQIGALPPRFGLLDDSPTRWSNFRTKIAELNASAPQDTKYKVFFLARHGQGYHNIAEAKYGTEAWDNYWSKLNGDGELVWGPDPLLTPLGIAQAVDAQQAWQIELQHGIPEPEIHYLSPLKRAVDTWKTTFLAEGRSDLEAFILEQCREEYGVHTCDLRSPLSHLRSIYPPPVFDFEPGFTEHDPLWMSDARESKQHIVERALTVLDRAFKENTIYISITAHGGFINGFLNAVGRPSYSLPTGGVLPVVVKRTVVKN